MQRCRALKEGIGWARALPRSIHIKPQTRNEYRDPIPPKFIAYWTVTVTLPPVPSCGLFVTESVPVIVIVY
jgi:hypothetical protein